MKFQILKIQVDLRHKDEDRDVEKVSTTKSSKNDVSKPPQPIDVGIDLSEFYMSVEWDILQVRIINKFKNLSYEKTPLAFKAEEEI